METNHTMDTNSEKKYRVSLGAQGMYYWERPVEGTGERAGKRQGYKMALVLCSAISAMGLAFGAILNVEFMLTCLLPTFAGMTVLITLVLYYAGRAPGNAIQKYRMSDRSIQMENGRNSMFFEFSKIQEIVIYPEYLELSGAVRKARVYIPVEDFAFVRDYIVTHTLGRAVVRYENAK